MHRCMLPGRPAHQASALLSKEGACGSAKCCAWGTEHTACASTCLATGMCTGACINPHTEPRTHDPMHSGKQLSGLHRHPQSHTLLELRVPPCTSPSNMLLPLLMRPVAAPGPTPRRGPAQPAGRPDAAAAPAGPRRRHRHPPAPPGLSPARQPVGHECSTGGRPHAARVPGPAG